MSKNPGEVIISAIFVVLLFLKVDPFGWTMPNDVQMVILVLVIVTFAVYAGLMFREKARDEREAQHIHIASRAGYLVGVALLVAGVVVGSLSGSLNSWLVVVLAGMIIGKMVAFIWARNRK